MNLRFIDKRYAHKDFVAQEKAQHLFILSLIASIGITALLIIAAITVPKTALQTAKILLPAVIASIISALLVFKGWYNSAANLFVLATAFMILFGMYYTEENAFSSTTHYGPVVIILAILFTKRLVAGGLLILYIGAYIFRFVSLHGVSIDPTVLSTARNDSIVSLVLTFIASLVIINTMDKSMSNAKDKSYEKEKEFLDKQKVMVDAILQQVGKLSESSTDMATTTDEFSINAKDQAAFVEEVTATVEEITGVIENVANTVDQEFLRINNMVESINDLSHIITDTDENIQIAQREADSISNTIKSAEDAMRQMQGSMTTIQNSSDEMISIVSIINDISDQINLLSLNASIEAARAGDSGRGFAVVADEISKLADLTATSIKDIDSLILANNVEIKKGLNNTDNTINTMRSIIDGVGSINTKMAEISEFTTKQVNVNETVTDDSSNMLTRFQDIKDSTGELHTVIDEISKSINNINELIQSNAEGAEKMAFRTQLVKDIALSLSNDVDTFTEMDKAG